MEVSDWDWVEETAEAMWLEFGTKKGGKKWCEVCSGSRRVWRRKVEWVLKRVAEGKT